MISEHDLRQLNLLRTELHAAVDRVIDGFLGQDGFIAVAPQDSTDPRVSPLEVTGEWTYRWPGGEEEVFTKSRWYEVSGEHGTMRVRVAWTQRPAWGRDDRARAVVFHQIGSRESTTYYPWTEFVETDDDRFAASIPDPRRPRATLSNTDQLPPRFESATVERSDRVFTSIADGPSLRLVVAGEDEDAMVRHGYWVAALRNRI